MSNRSLFSRVTIALTALVVLFYAVAIGYLKVKETDLVFERETAPGRLPAPADSLHLPYETVTFETSDSVRLTSWVVPSADSASGLWVLLCHGQTGNLATTTRPEYYAYLRAIGVHILAFDWRGFGVSGGTPSEAGLYRDATAAYEYLRTQRKVPADSIVIFGHSLGSGPATELATRVRAAGLVLEGGPTSVANRGQELYPFLPVRLVAGAQFNSIGRIGSVTMPILFLHSREDTRIPVAHGRALFEAATSTPSKRFVELKGAHHEVFLADSATYFGEYARFVAKLRQPR
jgi:uncharacterized protein